MTVEVLKKVQKLETIGAKATTTSPIAASIQEEIIAGNLCARPLKCGPLNLSTGEQFLSITEAGRKLLIEEDIK